MPGLGTGEITFSVRRLMIYISLSVFIFGACTWFVEEWKAARIDAVRQAYFSGRLTLEEARSYVGDRVDAWPKPNSTE